MAAVTVVDRHFELHRSATSMDQLIEAMEDGPDPQMPYWAHLWPASHGLATQLIQRAPLRGRAIELGCGLGLVGLAAAAAGLEVTLTDIEPRALELAAASAVSNELTVDCRLLDWRDPGQTERYDWVLGADLLYEEDLHRALLDLLPRLVAPGGRVLLSDPCRAMADPFYQRLHDDFLVSTLRFPIEFGSETHRVTIFELELSDAG